MNGMWFFWIALALTLIALVLYWPSIACWIGEFRVGMALAGLPKKRYTLLHHVLISDEYGRLLRIDHLICGPTGYFVIDSSPLTGRIRGGSSDQEWIRISAAGNRYYFSNPLRQNERHVEALRHIVGQVPIYNLVVFSRARLMKQRTEGTLTPAEIVNHILGKEACDAAFDSALSMRNLYREMITSRRAHGRVAPTDGWRRPLGNLMIGVATCVIVFSQTPKPAAKPHIIVRYKPVRATNNPAKKLPQTDLITSSPHQLHFRHTYKHHRARHIHEPMQVIAMSDGMASILENGKVITLHNGQRSPLGWRLIRATPQYADMIDAHGHHFHFTP